MSTSKVLIPAAFKNKKVTINKEQVIFKEPRIRDCLNLDNMGSFDSLVHFLAIASGKPTSFFYSLKSSKLLKLSEIVAFLNQAEEGEEVEFQEPTIEMLCLLDKEGEEVGTIRHTLRLFGLCRMAGGFPAPVKSIEGFLDYPYSAYVGVRDGLNFFRDDESERMDTEDDHG